MLSSAHETLTETLGRFYEEYGRTVHWMGKSEMHFTCLPMKNIQKMKELRVMKCIQ